MNIFVLACAAANAADLHCDQHCVKMILETAQLLYTHLDAVGVRLPRGLVPYKPTHKHHPCALWLHGGRAHFFWLLELGLGLCRVYTQRYGKRHKTEKHLRHMATHVRAKRLLKTCNERVWLERLARRGIKPKVVRACAAKVCLADPPRGCHFGVACMSDETVPLEVDERGNASTVDSYRSLMGHKQAVDLKKMRWAKQDEPPLALVDWVS